MVDNTDVEEVMPDVEEVMPDVKEVMHDDHRKYGDAMAELLSSAVQEEIDGAQIGCWTENALGGIVEDGYVRPAERELPRRPDDFMDRSKISWENMEGYLGVTHYSDGSITMANPDASRAERSSYQATINFLNGENPAQFAVLLHEVNHAKDVTYLGIVSKYHTPTNAVRFDNLSENVSHSVSYLALANYYQQAEKQGIETIQINGETKPLSYILDTYPGLRETYEKYGLDLSDAQSVSRYVKLGIEYKNGAKEAYDAQMYQHYKASEAANNEKPWSARVSEAKTEDKDYDRISHKMVSRVYIGLNTCVDLSPCYDMLNDVSKQDVYDLVDRQSSGREQVIPSENLVAIDQYMDRQGISNEEKSMYLGSQFFAITSRDAEADEGLKKLMLQSQLQTSQGRGATIRYDDGTCETVTQPEQKSQQQNIFLSHLSFNRSR